MSKKGGYFECKTDKIDTTIAFCIFKFQFEQFWIFGPNLPKKYIYGQKQKQWTSPLNSASSFIDNFHIFWPDLPKKVFPGLKKKKWAPHIFHIILHIQISLVRNFSSNWQFLFSRPNWPKNVFPVKNWKSEHHHWTRHIQIRLGTKFSAQTENFDFFDQICPKRVFLV